MILAKEETLALHIRNNTNSNIYYLSCPIKEETGSMNRESFFLASRYIFLIFHSSVLRKSDLNFVPMLDLGRGKLNSIDVFFCKSTELYCQVIHIPRVS